MRKFGTLQGRPGYSRFKIKKRNLEKPAGLVKEISVKYGKL